MIARAVGVHPGHEVERVGGVVLEQIVTVARPAAGVAGACIPGRDAGIHAPEVESGAKMALATRDIRNAQGAVGKPISDQVSQQIETSPIAPIAP